MTILMEQPILIDQVEESEDKPSKVPLDEKLAKAVLFSARSNPTLKTATTTSDLKKNQRTIQEFNSGSMARIALASFHLEHHNHTMNLSKVLNQTSWLLYKATSIPSKLVGWGLYLHKHIREDNSVNESKMESYHRPTSRHYWS